MKSVQLKQKEFAKLLGALRLAPSTEAGAYIKCCSMGKLEAF